jgi:hypothetical protein
MIVTDVLKKTLWTKTEPCSLIRESRRRMGKNGQKGRWCILTHNVGICLARCSQNSLDHFPNGFSLAHHPDIELNVLKNFEWSESEI